MEEQRDHDKELTCQDCQSTFLWTAGEQRFYREHNFTPPKRCPSCRAYLKRKLNEREQAKEAQNG
jgi:NAD-dependent SIR2 family protein deacetylase